MGHRKFLILRLGAVGDVIRTLPAVKALKDYYPSSHIAWVVEEPSQALVESQPEIDEVILFPRKSWTNGMRSATKMWWTAGEALEFISDLRRRGFDTVFDFHGILKSGLISFFSGAPKRIGFDRRFIKEGNFLFSNVKVQLQEERVSRYQRNFGLLKGIGLKVNGFRQSLHIPQRDQEYVESFFNSLSIPAKSTLIAIHPGTSPKTLYKRWMPNQYSQLADRLIRELRASIIFTWGPEEFEWVESIQKEMKEISFLGPKTESLTQLGEVYRRCDLYVGGDTGPMHIASFMGIPVVVIYGPTDPIVNEPLGQHRKVRKEVGCNPCRNRSCKELTCLKVITVEDVFQATKEILGILPNSAKIEGKGRSSVCH
jgi:lipopolysaccharide heptosyltransferase II